MSNATEYDIKLIKSPVPYYAVGVFWLLCLLFFPLYLWYHYVIAAAVSVAIYYIFGRIFPPQQIKVPRPVKLDMSGDAEIDKQIRKAETQIKNVDAFATAIDSINPALSADARALVASSIKIVSFISKNPDKANLVRRFLTYYLPMLEKLLQSYIDFKRHNTAAETAKEIETTAAAMKDVFQKQIDKLLSDREIDISTDIDVLESMLKNS